MPSALSNSSCRVAICRYYAPSGGGGDKEKQKKNGLGGKRGDLYEELFLREKWRGLLPEKSKKTREEIFCFRPKTENI